MAARPRIPFYKDERVVGRVTSATVLRFFVLVVIAGFVLFGVFLLAQMDANSRTEKLAKKIEDTQTRNHKDRLKDQEANELRIRQLYCNQASILRAVAPDSKLAKQYASQIEGKYKCSTLNLMKPAASPSLTTPPSSRPSSSPSQGPLPRLSLSALAPSHSSSPTSRPRQSRPAPSPSPRPSRTTSPSSPSRPIPATQPPLLQLPSLCVLKIVCT